MDSEGTLMDDAPFIFQGVLFLLIALLILLLIETVKAFGRWIKRKIDGPYGKD